MVDKNNSDKPAFDPKRTDTHFFGVTFVNKTYKVTLGDTKKKPNAPPTVSWEHSYALLKQGEHCFKLSLEHFLAFLILTMGQNFSLAGKTAGLKIPGSDATNIFLNYARKNIGFIGPIRNLKLGDFRNLNHPITAEYIAPSEIPNKNPILLELGSGELYHKQAGANKNGNREIVREYIRDGELITIFKGRYPGTQSIHGVTLGGPTFSVDYMEFRKKMGWGKKEATP